MKIYSEKAVTSWECVFHPWDGAQEHWIATRNGFVKVFVVDTTWSNKRKPRYRMEIILGGRRYRVSNKLRRMPTKTGVARMAGKFAALAVAERWRDSIKCGDPVAIDGISFWDS
jgi:hypothetical protein